MRRSVREELLPAAGSVIRNSEGSSCPAGSLVQHEVLLLTRLKYHIYVSVASFRAIHQLAEAPATPSRQPWYVPPPMLYIIPCVSLTSSRVSRGLALSNHSSSLRRNAIPTSTKWDSGTALLLRPCTHILSILTESFHVHICMDSPGTLPAAQNNPQKAKYDLYTESVSPIQYSCQVEVVC